ncbi:MAG TPA: cupin domain-containing protein [Candidatus Limnocylindrales bacterium]
MKFFDKLVEQWGGRSAMMSALGRQRMHGRIANAESLITWDGVGDLLLEHRLGPPHLRVVETAGRPVNPARYMDGKSSPRRKTVPIVDAARLQSILENGATLVIDSVDEMLPAITEAAYELSDLVSEPVQTHIYATCGDAPAFAPHWDVLDVLAVQVEGTKHWDVYGPGTPSPLDAETDADNVRPAEPEWSGVLEPGDALYLPRGWWHGVHGTGGTSLHLSFGFQRRTGMTYVGWLVTLLRHEAAFRDDLPVAGGGAELQAHEKLLAERLVQLVRDHPLEEYLAEHLKSLTPPVPFRLDPK